jgi:hypothetical protein
MEKLDNKSLCLLLMKANSEEKVIEILKENGYWDDPNSWRYYGDKENNYSAAGNQADEAEAALVEKITNARDAILMNECMLKGIDPRSDKAPSGVRAAVAEFFETNPRGELAGQIKEWDKSKRREVAKLMSVYLTGPGPRDSYPSINIADKGEGQTPKRIPETILSLGESIKRNIRFVHGKWNMGGTAALVFCGKRNFQFVLSKRNPKLKTNSTEKHESDDNWGFTIVRREDPQGLITSSTYKYLAPVDADKKPTKGELLSFSSDTMPIFAEYNKPYSVESEWGTLIKLYEYETSYRQNVQGNGGLLRPLDLLAPDLGLPFRLHECRYDGDPGSFEHQVNGLRVRLHDQSDKVLEPGYPTYHNPENIEGEKISIAVYAFKEDKAKNYRDNDKGCVFVLNGQSQGWLDDRLFTRNKVGLGFIKNSLLVMVDCSEMTYRGQERLFVNDRVHMKKGTDFFDKIESEIVDYLAHHKGLAELQEERKRKLRAEKTGDDKPLEAVLANVFRHSSALSKIFLKGEKLSNAFKSEGASVSNEPFVGVQYPTYFKFKKLDYGQTLRRETHVGAKARIAFETDAENDYFNRKTNPGSYKLLMFDPEGEPYKVTDDEATYGLNLFNGTGTLNIHYSPKYKEGDVIWLMLEVTDPLRIIDSPFQNKLVLDVMAELENDGGKTSPRPRNPDKIPGKDLDKPSGVAFPKINPVYEKDWGQLQNFNKYSAMQVDKSKVVNPNDNPEFTFFVNMDNIYLQHEIKSDVKSKGELEAYFKYGMALLGISLIYDDQQNRDEKERFEGLESRISEYSRAMGPIIIPMIKEFHNLDLKDELIKELAS